VSNKPEQQTGKGKVNIPVSHEKSKKWSFNFMKASRFEMNYFITNLRGFFLFQPLVNFFLCDENHSYTFATIVCLFLIFNQWFEVNLFRTKVYFKKGCVYHL
jgi:hypothetical protein